MAISLQDLLTAIRTDADERARNERAILKYYEPLIVPLMSLPAVHVWADAYECNVGITGGIAELVTAFRIFRRHGFVPDERPKRGTSEYTTRFRHADGARFWFRFASTLCRRVQVGTITVEQPVYETVCDSEEMPAALPLVEPPPAQIEDLSQEIPF